MVYNYAIKLSNRMRVCLMAVALVLGFAVAQAQTPVPKTESFDIAGFPPAGFTHTPAGSGLAWDRITTSVHPTGISPRSGAGFARLNSWSVSSGTALLSVQMDKSARGTQTDSVSLWIFRDAGIYSGSYDSISVWITPTNNSTAGGTSLGRVNHHYLDAPTVAAPGWYRYAFALPTSISGSGPFFLTILGTSYYGDDCHFDDLSWNDFPAPMSVSASNATQANTSVVSNCAVDQEIIGMSITTVGALNPLSVSRFNLKTTGTTNVADILNAKIYYTGTSATFATTNLFGTLASPTTSFNITGSQQLAAGTNYFWLTYDVNPASTIGNVLDAVLDSVRIVNAANSTPTTGNPAGSRQIVAGLSGVYTIDNTISASSTNFTSFTSAINFINSNPVCGNVTFNVKAGTTYNERPPAVTAQGTSTRVITFQKSGSGANPIIVNNSAGVNSPTSFNSGTTMLGDAVFTFAGAAWVTIDAIDIGELIIVPNPSEYGYYFARGGTDVNPIGNKNITIKNCTVTLNKANTASIGIGSMPFTTTGLPVTVSNNAGVNDGITIINNNISNVYNGVVWYGFAHSTAPYNFYDQNITIGSTGNGNNINNFGGSSYVTNGIWTAYANNQVLNSNNISGASGTTTTVYGIWPFTALGANIDANGNTITFTGLGSTATSVYGINFTGGNVVTGVTNTVNANNNTFSGWTWASNPSFMNVYPINMASSNPVNLNMNFNTISNMNLTTTSSNLNMYGFYNNVGAGNVNVSFSNNTIQGNTFTSASYVTCYGVYHWPTTVGNNNYNINNNLIQNNNIVSLTYTTNYWLIVNGGNYSLNSTCNVNGNTIQNNQVNSGSYMTVYNILTGGTSGNGTGSRSNNTINNCRGFATTYYNFYGVYNTNGQNNLTMNNNTVTNTRFYGLTPTSTSSSVAYSVYNSSTNYGAVSYQNNLVQNCTFTNPGGGGTVYLMFNAGAGANVLVQNNKALNDSVAFNTTSSYSTTVGMIRSDMAGHVSLDYNHNKSQNIFISNGQGQVIGNIIASTTSAAPVINVIGNRVSEISILNVGNSMFTIQGAGSLSSTVNMLNDTVMNVLSSGPGNTYIGGIIIAQCQTGNIRNCFVTNIQTNCTTLTNGITGIIVSGIGTHTVANNMVSNLYMPNGNYTATANAFGGGIVVGGGYRVNLYHNTVYVNLTSTATTFGFNGVNLAAAGVVPTLVDMRNNIIINTSDAIGGVFSAVIKRNTSSLVTYLPSSTGNYLVNGSGANNYFYYDYANGASTISTMKNLLCGRELTSFTTATFNPTSFFVNLPAGNLRLTSPTVCESNGVPSPITTDIDGQARNASTPDIGADEGSFTQTPAAYGPNIVYTPLTNGAPGTSRTNVSVDITTPAGVNTSAGLRPRLYFKRSIDADAYNGNTTGSSAGWRYVEASNTSSPFIFNIDYTLLPSGSVSVGDNIQYFVIAQDLATIPNVNINSAALVGPISSVNLGAGNFPSSVVATCPINSYSIVAGMEGTYYLGAVASPSGPIGSLTNPFTSLSNANTNGFFQTVNSSTVVGNIQLITMSDDTVETGTVALNQWAEQGVGNYTITVCPDSTGLNRVIRNTTGAAVTNGLVRTQGADRLIFDGRSRNAAGSIVGSTTAMNLTVQNTSTSCNNFVFNITSNGAYLGSTDITIQYTRILSVNSVSNCGYGIYVQGYDNHNLKIMNDSIYSAAYGLYTFGGTTGYYNYGWEIRNNVFGSAPIDPANPANLTVNNRYISYRALFLQDLNGTQITGNQIINVYNNNVELAGIYFNSHVTNAYVNANRINNIRYVGTSTSGAHGIVFVSSTGCINNQISNNWISKIAAANWTSSISTTGSSIGITMRAQTFGSKIWNNTVVMNDTITFSTSYPTGGFASAAILVSSGLAIDVRNNIFVNTMRNGNGSNSVAASNIYGIYYSSTAAGFAFLNNNNYYAGSTGTGVNNWTGYHPTPGNRATIADWKTTFGFLDTRSVSRMVNFVGEVFSGIAAQDLHIGGASVGDYYLRGSVPPTVSMDYDGNTRIMSASYMGADEVVSSPLTMSANAGTPAAFCAGGSATLGGSPTLVYTSNGAFSFSSAPTYSWTPATGLNNANIANPVASPTTTTTYNLTATDSMGFSATAAVTITVNPKPAPTITGSGISGGAATVCASTGSFVSTQNYSVTNNPGSIYSWSFTPGTAGSITSGSSSNSVTLTFGTTNVVGKLKVTETNTFGCSTSDSININVTSTPTPTVSPVAPGTNQVCINSVFQYSVPTFAGRSYVWSAVGGSVSAGQGTGTVTIAWNGTAGAGSVSVIETITSGGCSGSGTYNVTKNNPTSLTPPTGPLSVCTSVGAPSAVSYNYSVSVTTGRTYTWSVVGGTITGASSGVNLGTISVVWGAAGIGTVTVVELNPITQCTATGVLSNIVINPAPSAIIAGPQSACANNPRYYTLSNLIGSIAASGFNWVATGGVISSGQGTQSVTVTWGPAGAGTLVCNLTTTLGCTGATPTFNVTINANPIPSISGPASVCPNTSATYNAGTSGATYVWAVTGGSISGQSGNSVTVLWGAAGAGSVSMTETNSNGCSASTSYSVTINPNPAPVVSGNLTVCSGTSNTYTMSNSGSYTWTVSGGTPTSGSGASAVITWTTPGVGTITVTGTNGICTANTVYNVNVNATPTPTVGGPATACTGTSATYSTAANPGRGYTWTVSAGGSITSGQGTNSITVAWNTAGANTVSVNEMITATGCSANSNTFNVTVTATPVSAISGSNNVCSGTTVSYSASAATTYSWSVIGGTISGSATASTVNVIWGAAGIGSVNLTSSNGACSSTNSRAVTINATPSPVISGPVAVCSGNNNQYSVSWTPISTYLWIVTGGTIVSGQGTNNIIVNWGAAGAGNVSLTETTKGTVCATTVGLPVTINATPTVNVTGNTTVCQNGTETYTATGTATSFTWSVVGGTPSATTGSSINVTWNAAGPGSITVVGSNGVCSSSSVTSIFVNTAPTVVITGSSAVCTGGSSNYVVSPLAGATYNWTITGGSITAGAGTNFITVSWGAAPGSGNVSVTVTNGSTSCATTKSMPVTINSTPTPSITGPASACANSNQTYSITAVAGTAYNWTVTGGSIISGQGTNSINVIWGAAGAGNVSIVHSTGTCAGNGSLAVTVNPLPAVPNIIRAGTILSTDATGTIQWLLNGSPISGATSATHNATNVTGTYTVTSTAGGCTSTSLAFGYVPTGVNALIINGLNIYPNPTHGMFEVTGTIAKVGKLSFRLTDATGKEIFTSNEGEVSGNFSKNIDLSNVAYGVYLLEITTDEGTAVRRVVKQ